LIYDNVKLKVKGWPKLMQFNKVLVVGLGQVGLPVAKYVKEKGGFDAYGYDILFAISLRSTSGDAVFFSATINKMSERTALPSNPIISIRLPSLAAAA
jgi:UDP-N-acetylmuramoylalanine-D-glutamate ligase